MTLKILPPIIWPSVPLPVAPRDTLNDSAVDAIDTQASVAAENAPLRVIYGQVRLGPLIACVLPYSSGNVLLCVWGHGECDSVVRWTIDDKAPTGGATATHYMGTADQTADATLIAAFAANAKVYEDALPGICYSVVYVPAGASSGFPRIHAVLRGRKVRNPLENIVPYSELLDHSSWTKTYAKIVPNWRLSPDGFYGFDKLVEDTSTGTHSCNRGPHTIVAGSSNTLSVYAYSGERTRLSIIYTNSAWTSSVRYGFDLTTGLLIGSPTVVGTASAYEAGMELQANGVWRCWVTAIVDASSTGVSLGLYLNNASSYYYAGDGLSGLYLWGVMINSGTRPMRYVPSAITFVSRASVGTYTDSDGLIQSAAVDVPRINYVATNLGLPPKLLVEPASTNLQLWSHELTNLGWVKTNANLTNSGKTGLDGWSGLWKLTDTATLSTHSVSRAVSVGSDPLQQFVNSIFASRGEITFLTLLIGNSTYTNTVRYNFDLLAGTIVGPATVVGTVTEHSAGIQECPDLTWRCWVTANLGSATSIATAFYTNNGTTYYYTGDGASSVFLWGAMLERGYTPSSLIYTDAAPVTRAADIVTSNGVAPVTVWSDNPALCLGDFISDAVYGAKRNVDMLSVADVAIDNDLPVGTGNIQERSRTLNLALEVVQPVANWLDTLRTYAGCWLIPNGPSLKLVSDKAATSSIVIDHASGHIQSVANVKKRGVQSTPTVMTISYTDTSAFPYKTGSAIVYAPGVLLGTTPRRESQVSLPGINRYSQAYREATERLNKLLLNDLSLNLSVFDERLDIEIGDVVSVSHPIGLTSKLLRVLGITGDYGRYALALVEYDPAVYSSEVASTPTYLDTNMPSPSEPPAVTDVAMVEEVYQLSSGAYASRWRVTWAEVTYSFLGGYRCELWIGSQLIQSATTATAEWPTAAVQEGQLYTAKVAVVSSIGSTGVWATQSAVAQGNQLVPGDVTSVTAFEAGGRVYINWPQAIDVDVWRYEVRYGTVGIGWEGAALIDRVDALRLTTDQIPVGTWSLYVKAIDSVGLYSSAAADCTVTVTLDASAFLINTRYQTTPALTNMAEFSLARADANRYFVSEDSVAWDTKFSSTLNTYTNNLATYHNSMTSGWLGESEDFGLLSGQWTGTASVSAISGAYTSYLGWSLNDVAWTYPSGLSQKLTARYLRMKHEALTTATLLVIYPVQSIRADVIPRTEVGNATSSASTYTRITLANAYMAAKRLTITPQGTAARSSTFDNVVLGPPTTFDVYIFNSAGALVATPFQWDFQGV